MLHRDLHVSGHARREDTQRLIRMVRPMNIIPAHGTLLMEADYATLAQTEGYRLNKDLFLSQDGNVLELN
jgi:ribonuclease J